VVAVSLVVGAVVFGVKGQTLSIWVKISVFEWVATLYYPPSGHNDTTLGRNRQLDPASLPSSVSEAVSQKRLQESQCRCP
jgi:hypothetical protein